MLYFNKDILISIQSRFGVLKQKIILLFLIGLFHGCSFNTYLVDDEVNQVTVVNYTAYKKFHRAYFTRENLLLINGRKYLYLYKKKTNDLAILLHRKNKYLLYSMSAPNQQPYTMKVTSKTKLSKVLKGFRKHGYQAIHSLADHGYVSSVSYKKYKGLKTILVETKKYSRLQNLYRSAIKSYNARKVRYVKTKLPKQLIRNYYYFYKKHATTREQMIQLQSIAKKLELPIPALPKIVETAKKSMKSPTKSHSSNNIIIKKRIIKNQKEHIATESDIAPEIKPSKIIPVTLPTTVINTKSFNFYLNQASIDELTRYTESTSTKTSLSYTQYTQLLNRLDRLKEEKLIRDGTLEELIEAYTINKNPKYKQRIMSLMKEKQEE